MPDDQLEAGVVDREAFSVISILINEALHNLRNSSAKIAESERVFDTRRLGEEFSVKLTQEIFHNRGYFFTFRAGVDVTNIQFAELTALLGRFSSYAFTQANEPELEIGLRNLQFHSTNEVRTILSNLWNSMVPDIDHVRDFVADEETFKSVSKTIKLSCAEIASRTIVVDFFKNSAAVFLPSTLSISLKNITINAGYVHSSGDLIYSRNTDKSSIAECTEKIERYLTIQNDVGVKVPFCLYTNGIFDKWESSLVKSEIRGGVNNLKFSGDKNYFGGVPLFSFRSQIEQRFPGRFHFVDSASHYQNQLSENDGRSGVFWLIRDRKLFSREAEEENEDIYIVYRQRFKNDDAICHFDEDKPAWIAPVTWPHSLTSAMLALTLERFSSEQELTIVDPFVGTGTSLIEAFKKYPRAQFWGGDLNGASEQAVNDNIAFFANARLSKLVYKKVKKEVASGDENDKARFIAKYDKYFDKRFLEDERIENWMAEGIVSARDAMVSAISHVDGRGTDIYRKVRILNETDFSDFIARTPAENELHKRIAFYFSWKTFCKNTSAIIDERLSPANILFDYLNDFLTTFEIYQAFKGVVDDDTSVITLENSCFGEQIAFNYPHLLKRVGDNASKLTCGKNGEFNQFWSAMIDALDGNHPDIVIMDPPYGFNTDGESLQDLAELYASIAKNVVESAGTETHLLMCLPEKSHNGQVIPNFVTKDWFLSKLFQVASGKAEIFMFANQRPGPAPFYRPPFYWRSPKALTRTIVHVIISNRSRRGDADGNR
ncbi:MAG: hypothetical protein AAF720_15545 [Pseudomonadota bacterium]